MGAGTEGLKDNPCSGREQESQLPDSEVEWATRRQASFLPRVRRLHIGDRDLLMRLIRQQSSAPGGKPHPAIGHEIWGTVRDFLPFSEIQCPFLGESVSW